jgi:ATP-dependent DNA helicase RecG
VLPHPFLEIVLREEERTGRAMPLDNLIALSRLRTERRLAITDLVPSLQKTEHEARRTIEKLTEAGLVEAHGSGRGRTYTLSANPTFCERLSNSSVTPFFDFYKI